MSSTRTRLAVATTAALALVAPLATRNAAVAATSPAATTASTSASQALADIQNNMAAYVVVEAEDHEAAARMFLNHPHFAIFPGDGVEVMPLLPVPGA